VSLGIIKTMTQDKNESLRPARLKPDQKIELALTDPATLQIKLPPYSGRVLNEMRTAKRAIVQVDDARVEIIFHDETEFPYSINVTADDFVERKLPKEGVLKRVVVHGHTLEQPLLNLPASAESTYSTVFQGNRTVHFNPIPELDLLVIVKVQ
jgi:hypothetical protein